MLRKPPCGGGHSQTGGWEVFWGSAGLPLHLKATRMKQRQAKRGYPSYTACKGHILNVNPQAGSSCKWEDERTLAWGGILMGARPGWGPLPLCGKQQNQSQVQHSCPLEPGLQCCEKAAGQVWGPHEPGKRIGRPAGAMMKWPWPMVLKGSLPCTRSKITSWNPWPSTLRQAVCSAYCLGAPGGQKPLGHQEAPC